MSKNDKTILIVDDELFIAMDVASKIKSFGYNSVVEKSGEKAIHRVLNNDDIDLILMDINLGKGIDGTEVAIEILKHKEIPIVFWSAHSDKETVQKVRNITRYGFVAKSLSYYILESSIEMAFQLFEAYHDIKEDEKQLIFQTEILDQIRDHITVTDLNGKIIYVNKAECDSINMTKNEIIGKTLEIYGDDSEYGATQKEILEMTLQKGEWKGEVINYDKNGISKTMNCRTWKMLDSKGQPIALIDISNDITDRKRAEDIIKQQNEELLKKTDELYRSKEQILTLSDNIPDGCVYQIIIDVKENRRFTYMSVGVEQLFGVTQSEALNNSQAIYDKFHKEDLKKLIEAEENSIKTMKPFSCEARVKSSEGNIRWLQIQSALKKRPDGCLVVDGICIDITERKQAEEQLKIANAEKEVLLKEIHHRVKNNLQTVQSVLNMQKHYTDNEDTKDLLTECIDRIQSMSSIHESLYQSDNLAKIDMQQYVSNLSSHLYCSYVKDDCVVRFYNEIDKIYLDIKKAVPLGLILNEIVTNCIKHAFKGRQEGKIYFSFKENSDKYELRVKDDGVGLPENVKVSTDINEEFKSYGMFLISIFTKQLDAELEVIRNNGTEYILIFYSEY